MSDETATSGQTYRYEYYLKDHLGNIRLSFTDKNNDGLINNQTEILQENGFYPFGMAMTGAWYDDAAVANNNYQYNGKELNEEFGLNLSDYGARWYDAAVGRWWANDPLADHPKQLRFSPYAAFGNNPVRNIDPDGRKFINFDSQGNYTGTTKDNWFHNLFVGSKGRVMNSDGSVQQKFKFADPKNDVKDIQSGVIKRVEFVKESDIKNMMAESGAFTHENKTANRSWGDRYGYIKEEGKGGGRMDFSYTGIPNMYPGASSNPLKKPSPMMFLVDGVAHNHMNFGNYLFGASGGAMGFTIHELLLGAHYNSVKNSKENGYTPQLDSDDDQFSISQGWVHSFMNNYKKMEFKVKVGN